MDVEVTEVVLKVDGNGEDEAIKGCLLHPKHAHDVFIWNKLASHAKARLEFARACKEVNRFIFHSQQRIAENKDTHQADTRNACSIEIQGVNSTSTKHENTMRSRT